jgi:predicted permease
LALYLRDIDIQSNADWSVLVYYWVLSAGFAIVAFFAFSRLLKKPGRLD